MAKKKIIPIVVIALLLAAMAGLLIWLNSQEEQGQDATYEAADTVYVLGGEESLRVTAVNIQNEKDVYRVVVDNSGDETAYTIEGMEDIPLQKGQLSGLISSASALSAKSVVAEQEADLAMYGLSSPRAVVSISAGSATPVLLIGDDAPAGQGTYAMLQGEETVYLITSSTAEKFLGGSLDFVILTVSEGSPETTIFDRAILAGTVREEPIVVDPLPEREDEGAAYFSSHQITAPVQAELDSQNGLMALMAAYGLSADGVAAVHPDEDTLETFGLTEPYSSIWTSNEEIGNFTLSASEPDGEGMVYLMNSAQPGIVYRVAAEKLDWLEAQVFDLRNKLVILPYIDSVASVTVATAQQTYVFELASEGDELVIRYQGTELDASNFRKFYQTMISASYREQGEAELDLEELEPLLEYTYRYRNSAESDVVRFYEGPARRMLISLNGEAPNYVESVYVDKVLEDVEKVINDQEVSTYI